MTFLWAFLTAAGVFVAVVVLYALWTGVSHD